MPLGAKLFLKEAKMTYWRGAAGKPKEEVALRLYKRNTVRLQPAARHYRQSLSQPGDTATKKDNHAAVNCLTLEADLLEGLQGYHHAQHVAQEVLEYVGEVLQPLLGTIA